MYKPEEGSAGEAGHGTVVDVLGRWLVAHLVGSTLICFFIFLQRSGLELDTISASSNIGRSLCQKLPSLSWEMVVV